jgi:pSer/pThr/pTyr-binding forkhead associated (FHA) protein
MNPPRDLKTRPLGNPSVISEAIFKDRYSGEIGVATKIALVVKNMRAKIILQVVDPLVIGRLDSENDTKLFIDLSPFGAELLGVSRRHLRLWSENNQLFVEDLASTNGTLFNGVRLPKNTPQRIHHGDQITLGGFEIEIEVIVDMLG